MAISITLSLTALFYNEEACVEQVVRESHAVLSRIGESFEIVAIQNGSLDGTPQILGRLAGEFPEVRILVIPANRGAGYGSRKGLAACVGEYVCGVSGDGQVDLQAIPAMFELMRQTGSDLAYGKRRARPDGTHRVLVSAIYLAIMRWVFGIESRDMNGLPKILKKRVLDEMRIVSDDQFLECEMMLKAARMGLRICALDVGFYARGAGNSSVGLKDLWDYLDHLTRVGLGIGDRWNVNAVRRSGHPPARVHRQSPETDG